MGSRERHLDCAHMSLDINTIFDQRYGSVPPSVIVRTCWCHLCWTPSCWSGYVIVTSCWWQWGRRTWPERAVLLVDRGANGAEWLAFCLHGHHVPRDVEADVSGGAVVGEGDVAS
jgi:hypothetical protein